MGERAKIIAIVARKGGVGKTTTAQGLAFCAARAGRRTLMIDLDAQGNLTTVCNIAPGAPGAYDFMRGAALAETGRAITSTFGIIPAQEELDMPAAAEGGAGLLATALDKAKARELYEYIIIDTPPTLGALTANALMAADVAIIPATADILSLDATGKTIEVITAARKANPTLKAGGVLITRYQPRQRLAAPAIEAIEQTAVAKGVRLYTTRIREAAAIREAQGNKRDIIAYNARDNNAGADYMALWGELTATTFKPPRRGRE